MVAAVAAFGIARGAAVRASAAGPSPGGELGARAWAAKWEIALPVLDRRADALRASDGGRGGGGERRLRRCWSGSLCTATSPGARLPTFCAECTLMVGGVLLILGVALGLTSYLVDAQVPMHLLDWAQAHLDSKWVFPAGAEPAAARGRLPDGHLLGDRGRRAADRCRSGSPSASTRSTSGSSSSPTWSSAS